MVQDILGRYPDLLVRLCSLLLMCMVHHSIMQKCMHAQCGLWCRFDAESAHLRSNDMVHLR